MLLILLGVSLGLVLLLLGINRVPLSYTLRNLTLRWRTTLMTALAFTLVVGLMVVMLAFTTGMQRMTEGSGQPGNVMILAEGAIDEVFSNLNVADLGEIENLPDVGRDGESGLPLASRETYLIVKQPVRQPQAGPAQRPLSAGSRHHRRGHGGQGPQYRTPQRELVLGGGRGGPLRGRQPGGAGGSGRAGRGRCRRTGRGPHAAGSRGGQESPPPRRGRSLPPGRRGLGRDGHPQVGRIDLQFRDLGQPGEGGARVRQRQRHHARAGHGRRRHGRQASRLPQEHLCQGQHRAPGGKGVLRQPFGDQPAVPLRHPLRHRGDGGGRDLRRDEHHVRRHQQPHQGYRRAPHPGLRPLAHPRFAVCWNRW